MPDVDWGGVCARAWVDVACRNVEAARTAADELKQETGRDTIQVLELDLARRESIRACVTAFLATGLPLHVLILNAGTAPRDLHVPGRL